jgi:hypothetical protein
MSVKNSASMVERDLVNPGIVLVEAKNSRSYRAPEKRLIGNLELIKGRNFNDDKDRGNENYYQ